MTGHERLTDEARRHMLVAETEQAEAWVKALETDPDHPPAMLESARKTARQMRAIVGQDSRSR